MPKTKICPEKYNLLIVVDFGYKSHSITPASEGAIAIIYVWNGEIEQLQLYMWKALQSIQTGFLDFNEHNGCHKMPLVKTRACIWNSRSGANDIIYTNDSRKVWAIQKFTEESLKIDICSYISMMMEVWK